jgi:hypothetical protein
MPRGRHVSRELRCRALESLTLARELFNRPAECFRADGVLILLHHAFEMLLKAAIYKVRGRLTPCALWGSGVERGRPTRRRWRSFGR